MSKLINFKIWIVFAGSTRNFQYGNPDKTYEVVKAAGTVLGMGFGISLSA